MGAHSTSSGRARFFPEDFADYLTIRNAPERFSEAREIGEQLVRAGIRLNANPDHAAIFTDPPALVAGPLKRVGYVNGYDCRCYPSPVDRQDYINVAASLPAEHPAKARGWWDHVAVVHPVDDAAREQMLSQGYGNPFIHHLTFGLEPPARSEDAQAYAEMLVRMMAAQRARIGALLDCEPGNLVMALPASVLNAPTFRADIERWVDGLDPACWKVEAMEGGGCLLQFFALQGGRIEVALRVDTAQVFNPKSVRKISAEEISTVQG